MNQSVSRAVLAAVLSSGLGGAQQILDLSAVANGHLQPVVVNLQPGLWRVLPIGSTGGGAHEAWHAWNGQNLGCGATPGACTQGWMWNYFVQCPGMPAVKVGAVMPGFGAPKFATAAEAHARAREHWFPLDNPTAVSFWIGDSSYFDNLGGVSLLLQSAAPTYPSFVATPATISVATGGTQILAIDGGVVRASHTYLVIGSASGSSPGLSAMHWHLPLNLPDPYLGMTLSNPNTSVHVGTLGVLDTAGRGRAMIVLPPGQDPAIAGLHLWHACITLQPFGITGTSAATQLDFVR